MLASSIWSRLLCSQLSMRLPLAGAYKTLISEVNALLNPQGATQFFGSRFTDAAYNQILNGVRQDLGPRYRFLQSR